MKKFAMAVLASSMFAAPAVAADVKIGVLLGFTGPAESIAPDMAAAAELAIKEVSDSGALLGGHKVSPVRGDTTCVDSSAAIAVAERAITSDKVHGIMGALCSGATTSVLENVAMAKGVAMISPSATSPRLSDLEDNDLFFRTAPSDARQGQVIADMLNEKGYKSVAISYTNNDYGKGLADSIEQNFVASGGKVTINASHVDDKPDYGAEVAALAQAGGDILIVAGYQDQGGKGIIQASIDAGAFDMFFLPDGMIGPNLPTAIGSDLDGAIGVVPGTDSPGASNFAEMAAANGFAPGPYAAESYDAAALLLLAMQAAGSTDANVYKEQMMMVANAPGEKIFPGELAKALKIIAGGGDVDYVGASAVELIGDGESAGNYREVLVKGGKNTTVGYR